MAFIETLPAGEDVANYERVFSHRPEVYAAWAGLNGAIKAGMDARRYELATLAAALVLRSSYCALAHASVLLDGGLASVAEVEAVVSGDVAPLTAAEAAVVAFAARVVQDATSITQDDVDALRAAGLDDTDVFDVVAAASARCFFSKTLDALGARADARYAALEPAALRERLTVGRPVADG
jgi:AhpD family alkylhydroperoxidase